MIHNKRGGILDVGLAMIILFIFGVIALTGSIISTEFTTKFNNATVVNQSSSEAIRATTATRDLINDRFDYVGFVLLIGFTLALIITSWYIAGEPIFIFIYFLVLIVLVAASAILSFVWERITIAPFFSTAISNFPILDFILQNLPIYITIMGFISMIVMYAKPRS